MMAAMPSKKVTAPANAAAAQIDAKLAELGDWRGERLAEIRAIIHDVDPAVGEEWKWRGTPVWSHDGMFALANAHKAKVKLTFVHGAKLPDPRKIFNAPARGNTWRAIDYYEGDPLQKTALKALLRAAIAYNGAQARTRTKRSR